MWGSAWQQRQRGSEGCWARRGGLRFFDEALAGNSCDRNWLQGAVGFASDRPFFEPSPALLGFDETINEFCSWQIGLDPWDRGDLNNKIARRCREARRNVLRVLTGGWDMCTNLEWQLCALKGLLPAQGSAHISFATPPAELKEQWFTNPSTHPTWPCSPNGGCPPLAHTYTVGDVYFAEVALAYKFCTNRADLFGLVPGELIVCQFDETAYRDFQSRLVAP